MLRLAACCLRQHRSHPPSLGILRLLEVDQVIPWRHHTDMVVRSAQVRAYDDRA